MLVRTRIASSLSPWLSKTEVDALHTIAIPMAEGRFVAEPAALKALRDGGQIVQPVCGFGGRAHHGRAL